MKWVLMITLALATVVIHLFISWMSDEDKVLILNKNLMKSELVQMQELQSLDKKVQKLYFSKEINISNKDHARKRLLKFFDQNKQKYKLSIEKYFVANRGMLYLELSAKVESLKKLQSFLKLFDSMVFIELQSLEKKDRGLAIKFRAYYPYKEYL